MAGLVFRVCMGVQMSHDRPNCELDLLQVKFALLRTSIWEAGSSAGSAIHRAASDAIHDPICNLFYTL